MTLKAIPRTIYSGGTTVNGDIVTTATTSSSSDGGDGTSPSSSFPSSPPRRSRHNSVDGGPSSGDKQYSYVPLNDGSSNNGNGNGNTSTSTPQRPRINSRDYPRSYSGLYGQGGDDLLPFELARNMHTDWLENGGLLLLTTYIGGILIVQVIVSALLDANKQQQEHDSVPLYWSWTITNALHCLVSTIYLHWLKGSLFDEQGEMAAMTLWEQLEGRSNTVVVKRTLTLVPTLLCYAACHFSEYSWQVCFWNIILWSIHTIAKLPGMNGVRIFGINRTTGIDDEYENKKES